MFGNMKGSTGQHRDAQLKAVLLMWRYRYSSSVYPSQLPAKAHPMLQTIKPGKAK